MGRKGVSEGLKRNDKGCQSSPVSSEEGRLMGPEAGELVRRGGKRFEPSIRTVTQDDEVSSVKARENSEASWKGGEYGLKDERVLSPDLLVRVDGDDR